MNPLEQARERLATSPFHSLLKNLQPLDVPPIEPSVGPSVGPKKEETSEKELSKPCQF
jgi:hypothetical protein